MTDVQRVVLRSGGNEWAGRILRLEGGGLLAVALDGAPGLPSLEVGLEVAAEMHDGGRFRLAVLEALPGAGEYRLRLVARG